MILSLIILALMLLLYYWYKRPPHAPPGPRGLPVLGMIPFLTRRPEMKFFKWSKKYGSVMSVRVGQTDWIVLNSSSSIKQFFIKHGEKMIGRPPNHVLDHILSHGKSGIVFSDGERWKNLRKFGEFALRNLGVGKSSFESNIIGEIEEMLKNIERRGINEPYNFRNDVSNTLYNILTIVIFGAEKKNELQYAGYDFLGDPYKAILFNMSILLPFLRFVPQVGNVLRESKQDKEQNFIKYESILTEKESSLNFDEVNTFVEAFACEKNTEIKHLGRNEHFTNKQFVYYVRDLFGAGVHTTTSTISWCFLGLLHHPVYQEKIRMEITEVIGNKKPYITARNSMPITMAYIQEIQRYCTVAPLAAPHSSTEDINIGGFNINKGTQIMINIWSAHNDPSVFNEPEIFRPERFLDEIGNFTPSKNVIAFSVGPRRCLGEQLARMEIFLIFASVLQRFRDKTLDLPGLNDGVLGIAYVPKPYKIVFEKYEQQD